MAETERSRTDALLDDPYGSYYFKLEVTREGAEHKPDVAHLVEVSGLKTAAQVFEFEEGGLNSRSHKRVGQSKWENLTVRFATSSDTYLHQWRDMFLRDQFDERLARSGSVMLCANDGSVLRRYHFDKAWPVSWEGPSFNAGSSELATESLELAHDGITISDE